MNINAGMQTPVRPTLCSERSVHIENTCSNKKRWCNNSAGRRPCQNSPELLRRNAQREKQISYGFVTEGYSNMIKLVQSDPLLKSGGILPLSPPDVNKGSKRTWDVSLRKWRRALHMFDNVFIEGQDASSNTLESVIEEQRLQWVSPLFIKEAKENRIRLSEGKIREAQNSAYVPKRLPVEESLKIILRSEDCYEPVTNVVPPSASSLIRGNDISPLDAGIKIYLAPSAHNQQNVTPQKPEALFYPDVPQRLFFNAVTPARVDTSPSSTQNFSPLGLGCQVNPGYNASLLNPSPELPYDSTQVEFVGNSQQKLILRSGSAFQPTVHPWNSIFAAPACASQSSNVPGVYSGSNRLRTPVTVPRRVTLLRGRQEDRKLGDSEIFRQSLSPSNNAVFSSTNTKIQGTSPVVSTERIAGNTQIIGNANENERSIIDLVSQKLFSEE
ncbi:hypothetical protein TraAM80_01740 [Trypanosoma rangeli]|uniref:Histone RNA hairpin-binding protein RNA-binding domain-containing protein n=1 Tax=Trypanosoma rangeli TaxID=5698 RepID=A0A422NXB7_TRYRA|nr:uncharacterized protein TraAM80_01740 [Trypanosoma rangeli]RNF10163.1 hypothetical protein TraAM80_01740 [Trypanosoma rangeli]|eukprot:RNF10163.1 hypothetical protein TraAM80_01740 [Trypanosoma rangeli]